MRGTQTIEAVVDAFFKRALDDAELKDFFAETNLAMLKRHMVHFVSMTLEA